MTVAEAGHSFADAMRTLMESASLGIWEFDIVGNVFHCNTQFESITPLPCAGTHPMDNSWRSLYNLS